MKANPGGLKQVLRRNTGRGAICTIPWVHGATSDACHVPFSS